MESPNTEQTIQIPQPQEQGDQPKPPIYSHSRTFYIILVILGITLLLSMLTIAVYLIGARTASNQQKQTTNLLKLPSPTPTTNSAVSPAASDAVGANWKTYSNPKLSVEFNYPPSWYISDYIDRYGYVIVAPIQVQVPEGTEFTPEPITIGLNQCFNTVTNQKFPCEKTVQERVNKMKNLMTQNSFKNNPVKISNKTGEQIEGITKPDQPGGNRYIKETEFNIDQYLLVATLYNSNNNSVYDQILSTFKFTDQISTNEDFRDLLIKCGDYPEGLNMIQDHFRSLAGHSWSPNCKYIAWATWEGGISWEGDDMSTAASKLFIEHNAKSPYPYEGLFLYNTNTKQTKRIIPPDLVQVVVFKEWKDNNTIIFKRGEKKSTYDINTGTIK